MDTNPDTVLYICIIGVYTPLFRLCGV